MLFIVVLAVVSLIFLSVLAFAVVSFIAKHCSLAPLKLLPGRKPSFLFGNALQLTGQADSEYEMSTFDSLQTCDKCKFSIFAFHI